MKRVSSVSALAACVAFVGVACDGELRFDDPLVDGAAPTALDSGTEAGPPGTCATDKACVLPSLRCETASQTCVRCTEDAHCGGATPHCDPLLFRCVECASSSDCTAPLACDPSTRRCRQACREGAETCPLDTRCNEGLRRCVECYESEHCVAGVKRTCDRRTGRCVACLGDGECAGARCDAFAGVCVECLSAKDCPSARPFCDLGAGACVASSL